MPHTSRPIDDALRPFAARAVRVSLLRSAIVGLTAIVVTVEVAWIVGGNARAMLTAGVIAAIAALAAGTFIANATRPSARDVARHLDRRGRFQNLIVTAVDCAGEGMPALVRAAATASLQSLRPADAYPYEPPRRWRSWLVAVVAVQVVVLAIAWRAPGARVPTTSMSSLTLPASSSASASTAAPARPDAAPLAGATPAAVAETSPDERAHARATTDQPRVSATDEAGTATERTTDRGDNDRVRLAAAHAESDLMAGRIPASKRTLVQRYFAAILHSRDTRR